MGCMYMYITEQNDKIVKVILKEAHFKLNFFKCQRLNRIILMFNTLTSISFSLGEVFYERGPNHLCIRTHIKRT